MPDLSGSRTQYENKSHNQVDNISQQNVEELVNLRDLIHIDLDMDELSQNMIIKIFEKTDGITYSQIEKAIFPTDFDTGVKILGIILDGGGNDMKLTLQSSIAEGMDRTIPYTLEVLTRP